jgi:hypothetical protein
VISVGGGSKGTLTITGALLGPTPGFGVDLVPWLVGLPYEEWVIPLWPLALIAAAPLMVLAFLAARRAHRRQHNRCPTCGYDLRGAPPTTGVATCPECGTVAAAVLAAVPS